MKPNTSQGRLTHELGSHQFFWRILPNSIKATNIRLLSLVTLQSLTTLALSSCLEGGSDFSSLDKKGSAGEGVGRCSIAQAIPNTSSPAVVPFDNSKFSIFSVSTQGTNCSVKFFLNNSSTPLEPLASPNQVRLKSSDLNEGNNLLRAEVSGPIGRDVIFWNIRKNSFFECKLNSPTLQNINVVSGSPDLELQVRVDTMDFARSFDFRWNVMKNLDPKEDLVERCEPKSPILNECIFKTSLASTGKYDILVTVTDGIDSSLCRYSVNVGPNCTISSKFPAADSLRWSYDDSLLKNFSVNISDPSCLVNWSINDNNVAGNFSSVLSTQSQSLQRGRNTIKAVVALDNFAQWSITRNSPPSAASLVPSNSLPVSTSVGNNVSFTAIIADDDGDTVKLKWFVNDIEEISARNQNTFHFYPTPAHVGSLTIKLEASDDFDVRLWTWNVNVTPACSISSSSPAGTDIFVSASAVAQTAFSVTASSGCNVSWDVDGISYGGGPVRFLSGSAFSPTGSPHTVTATVSNAGSSVTRTWQVRRNILPTCASYNPPNSGHAILSSTPQTFQLAISDSDSSLQTYDYEWKLNGSAAPFTPTSSGLQTQATWTPTPTNVGSNNLLVDVKNYYRGTEYDLVTCMWNTIVLPQCVISEKTPASNSIKVPFNPTHETSFSAVSNHSSCAITWELNSSTVGGGSFYNVVSSSLGASNTLKARATNAVSSIETSWSVTKNAVANCGTQSPAGPQSIELGDSLTFSGSFNNPDSDPLSYQWYFAGAPISGATSSSFTFAPNLSHLGTNQLLRLRAFDGYDESYCDWSVTVSDPNTAQILSAYPTTSPTNPAVILSTGSQNFSVTATGTGLTYKWYLDNVLLTGRNGASETFTYLDIAPGAIRELKVIVTDAYNNTAEKIFNVKRNQKPVINSVSPTIASGSTFKTNIGVAMTASLTASDADGDSLTYNWTLNNMSQSSHPSGILNHNPDPSLATSAQFHPSNNSLYLGTQQLRVIVSDGHESVTHLWPISVNYFSTTCNSLFNSPVSTAGGKVCTLVGNPSIGHGEDVIYDPTRLKISPNHVIELEPNVYAYADGYYHVIGVVNDTNTSKTYFGQSIPSGQMKVVLGVGQRGRNLDASSYTQFWGVNASGENYPNFKIFDPNHLVFDPSGVGVLYIADRGNNRVLALIHSGSKAGQVIRVLGLANGATSSTANEGLGINTSCGAPSGVALNQEGSNKYLYVTCSSQHQIKKVDITDFNGNNIPNFQTTIAVGRLASNNQPTNTDANLDGIAGGSFDPVAGAVARTNTPWGIFAHNGLVFFSDYTRRIRVLNTTGSSVDFYPHFESHADKFISSNLSFQAAFLSSPLGTSTFNNNNTLGLNATLISSGTVDPTKYILYLPNSRISNACHVVTIHSRDASSNIITTATPLNPTVTAGAAVLFTNPDCSGSGSSSITVTIPTGRSFTSFWVKTSSNVNLSITGVSGSFSFNSLGGTSGSSADTSGVFYSFITSPASVSGYHVLDCLPLELRIAKTNNSSDPVVNMTTNPLHLAISHNNIGTFFSDAACSNPISRVTLAASSGPAIRTVFYRRSVIIPPGFVSSIFGSAASLATPSNYSSGVGNAVYSGVGYWLAPFIDGGVLKGIVYNPLFNNTSVGNLNHTVSFLNLMNTSQSVGTTVAAYSSASIANAINGTAGYINDNVPALSTRFNSVKGLFVSQDQHVLVSDYANRRVRKVELFGTNGLVKAALGLGRTRDRSNDMSAEAFQANLAYPYKLEFINQRLYFSELWNHRIRYVDLNTGVVSTAAGIGWGTTFFDGNDATAEPMMNPRGFKIIAWPNSVSPTHYVLVYAQPYQIRAVNLSSTVLNNFFGVNLLPGKVRTIAGNNAITSGDPTGWGSNTEGMNAIGATIRQAYDLAFIKGNIYIADFNDQCLLRVTPNGKLYQVNPGTCNTSPTTTAGEFGDFAPATPPAAFRMNRPIAFGEDASLPGNYFILGNYYDANSQLYYINSLTSNIMFFGFGSPRTASSTSNIAHASWLYNIPTFTGSSRAQAITSWAASSGSVSASDRICWATGDYDQQGGSFPGGTNGEHSIYCTVRTSAASPVIVAGQGIGPGGPIGMDQEGLSANTASFYGPTGLAFDDEGNLYVADSGNHIIRMIRRWWP